MMVYGFPIPAGSTRSSNNNELGHRTSIINNDELFLLSPLRPNALEQQRHLPIVRYRRQQSLLAGRQLSNQPQH